MHAPRPSDHPSDLCLPDAPPLADIYIGAIIHNQFYYQLLANPLWCIVFGYVGVNALYLKFLVIWR